MKDNESLLERINENLVRDMNLDWEMKKDKIINIFINIKHDVDLENEKIIKQKFETKGSRISKPVNLINYFFQIIKEEPKLLSSYEYFRFFRAISANYTEAVSINQDSFYHILTKYKGFFFSVFNSFYL